MLAGLQKRSGHFRQQEENESRFKSSAVGRTVTTPTELLRFYREGGKLEEKMQY